MYFGSDAREHPDVVVQITPAVEHSFHRNRAGEIILQYLARNRMIKMIVARNGVRGRYAWQAERKNNREGERPRPAGCVKNLSMQAAPPRPR